MRLLRRRCLAIPLALLGALSAPTAALAQSGFYLTPAFSVAEVYDDNIFSTPSSRESDFISRFTPDIQAGYRSAPLTLLGRYTLDAEVFAEHAELNSAAARQLASIDLRYLPTPRLTLSLTGSYVDTHTPGELNVESAIEVRRARAQRLSGGPSAAYRFDARTEGTLDYMFSRDQLEGGVTTDAHVARLGLDRRLTTRDTGSLGYTFRRFFFDGDESTSHAVTLGWIRDFTAFTSATLRAGPRFSDGSVDPELSLSILHRLQRGELSLFYARTLTTVIGEAGAVETDSVGATVSYTLLPRLDLRAAPSFSRSSRDGGDLEVYRFFLEAGYRVNKWIELAASYQWSFEQGRLEATSVATARGEEIIHNIFLLRLTFTYPYRID